MLRLTLFIFITLLSSAFITLNAQRNSNAVTGEWIIKFFQHPDLETTLRSIHKINRKDRDNKILTENLYLKTVFENHNIEVAIQRFFTDKQSASAGIERIYIVTVTQGQSSDKIINTFRSDPSIEYVEENRIMTLDNAQPGDPYIDSLYWINLLQAGKAWTIEKGSDSVVIGIIDTGIDFFHPELQNRIYHNPGETGLDAYGRDKRTNNTDDDSNGFIDDWQGWDFTDIPGLSDSGDVTLPDNDPSDENGHGTAMAGIIAAEGENQTGITGVAYGCRVLPVRCGTSSGLLQTDDIARAIVYAADRHVQVINMSFSDVTLSALLRDAIEYAYQKNCVLVASAGNDASTQLRYPAGFDRVIAVSATDQDDFIAPFSNFGSWITVAAPGVRVMTTSIGGQYRFISGTSASAPLVAGLAALILSRFPAMDHETVRSVITSSADDIGNIGWDPYYGAGRINAFRALSTPYATVARIDSPGSNTGTAAGTLVVKGTAAGALMKKFTLYYGAGSNPTAWNEITAVENRQIVNDTLAVVSVAAWNEGTYIIRLKTENKDGTVHEARNRIFIDRSAPVISSVFYKTMINGNNFAQYFSFRTDDYCSSELFLRPALTNGTFTEIPVLTFSKTHSVVIGPASLRQWTQGYSADLFAEVTNSSGLKTRYPAEGFLSVDLSGHDFSNSLWLEDTTYSLPLTYLLPDTADLDQNGKTDLIANALTGTHQFNELKIFEYDPAYPGRFRIKHSYGFNGVPRDALNNAYDGKSKLLIGDADRTIILESEDSSSVPLRQIFRDSLDFWGSRFLTFPNDAALYMLSKKEKKYQIHKRTGTDTWIKMSEVTNPSRGENLISVPGSAAGDFDGDGQTDVLLADYDGDIYIIENQNGVFANVWRDSLPLIDPCGFLAAGDIDHDGVEEFVTGCRTGDPTSSSDPNQSYWLFRIYRRTGDNQYQALWEQYFYGYFSQRDYRSGLHVADTDGEPGDEVLINVYPHGYVFKWNAALQTMDVIWQNYPVRSNVILPCDPDGNGSSDLIFNNGTRTIVSSFTGVQNAVRPPDHFTMMPLDTERVSLSWRATPGATFYRLYTGPARDQLQWLCDLSPARTDTILAGLVQGQVIYAALTTFAQGAESPLSAVLNARPNAPPRLTGLETVNDRQLILSFSEPMDYGSLEQLHSYSLSGHDWPLSAIPVKSGNGVLLTYPGFIAGNHSLRVSAVYDSDGTPIDTSADELTVAFTQTAEKMYVVRSEYLGNNRIAVTFSEPVDEITAASSGNYLMEPAFTVVDADIDSADRRTVILFVQGEYAIGATGIQYIIKVTGVRSADGKPLDEIHGNRTSLIFTATSLDHVFVYPNPCRQDEHAGLTFASLTSKAVIKVYTTGGKFVREIREENSDGGVRWDLLDYKGRRVTAGVYIFIAESGGKKVRGKFAIIK